ncbi:MAG TPA: hypothetical protein VGI78_22015 [Acetobacteraceae bacterium]
MSHVVCRPTRREAEEFYHYFAEEMADAEGQAYYRRQRGPVVKDTAGNELRRPLVNSFMRAYMRQMSQMGLAGTSVAFLDYLKEIAFFVQEVLPRLTRLGLRREE